MVHIRTALTPPEPVAVDAAFKFISRLPPFSKPPLLIVLLIADTSFYNQKTVPGQEEQFLAQALLPHIQLLPSLGFHGLNLSILVHHAVNI